MVVLASLLSSCSPGLDASLEDASSGQSVWLLVALARGQFRKIFTAYGTDSSSCYSKHSLSRPDALDPSGLSCGKPCKRKLDSLLSSNGSRSTGHCDVEFGTRCD